MRAEDLQFVFAGRPFFTAGGHLLAEPPLIGLESLVCSGWRVERSAWWTFCTPARTRPARAGWKLHLSPGVSGLVYEVERAVQILASYGVPFKVLSSAAVERRSRAKFASRTQAGKVVTAYPGSVDQAVEVASALNAAMRHPGGPGVIGDLHLGDGPVYLRYGAFEQTWLAADGVVLPGVRNGSVVVVDDRSVLTAEPPPPIRDLLTAAAPSYSPPLQLPLTEPVVLHRTAGGSVYAGSWNGRPAVLKEGRHGAGLDAGGSTAAERLRHEALVLERLAGSGAAPEPIELVEAPDSVFLVMERLPGITLHRAFARRHPPVFATEQTIAAEGEDYRQWSARVREGVHARLEAAHARGVVHGDVSPQNVLVDGYDVYLIDYEAAVLDGVQVSTGVTTPGFGAAEATGETDLAALDAFGALFINPLLPALTPHRPFVDGIADDLIEGGAADLEPGFRSRPGRELIPEEDFAAALLAGIRGAVSTCAGDPLFPGGVRSFTHPVAPLSVSHGAAGIVSALLAVGEQPDAAWLDALEERTHRAPDVPGAGEGLHGVARVLAEVGRLDAARDLMARLPASPADGDSSWATGNAGRAICLLTVAAACADPVLFDRGIEHLEAVLGSVDSGRTGLLRGQAGVALALSACADLLDAGGGSSGLRLRDRARQCLDTEPRQTDPESGFVLSPTYRGLLPSIDEGIAAQSLARHQLGLDPDEGIIGALRAPACALGGLFSGRAGLLAGLAVGTDPDDPSVLMHRRRLAWYAIRIDEHPDAAFILSDANMRPACDLATGSAGVLASLAGPRAVLRALGLAY